MENKWMMEFVAKRAGEIEERLSNDPYFVPIRDKLERLKKQLVIPENFRMLREIESLEDALEGIIKDEFYLQGIRDGIKLAQEPEGIAFPEYYHREWPGNRLPAIKTKGVRTSNEKHR